MPWYNPFSWGEGQKAELDPNLGKLPYADLLRKQMQQGYADVQFRQAPGMERTTISPVTQSRAPTIATGPQDQFRGHELSLAQRLMGIGSGQQQGAGELAVQRQGQRAAAQQIGMARMQRGAGAGMAGLTAARNVGNLGVATAGQAQQAALNDQMAANQAAAGVLAQGRGADIGLATSQAGLQQQTNLANMDAQNQRIFQQAGLDQARSLAEMQSKLQTMGMNDQASLGYLSQLFGVSQAEMQGMLQAGALQVENYKPGFFGDLLVAGGTVGAAAMKSDRRLKADIKVGEATVDALLDSLKPYSYRYKDERHGKGERAGIMAQDLERSEAGRRMVINEPDGKAVDMNKAVSAALAAAARLNQRLRKLEGNGK